MSVAEYLQQLNINESAFIQLKQKKTSVELLQNVLDVTPQVYKFNFLNSAGWICLVQSNIAIINICFVITSYLLSWIAWKVPVLIQA